MNTAINALDQLKPNIIPEPINWWPVAYGWWAVALIAVITIAIVSTKVTASWLKNRYRKQGLKQLTALYKQYNAPDTEKQYLHCCNRLLKKIALRTYTNKSVAKLCGIEWLEFLSQTAKMPEFINGSGKVLGDLRFQNKIKINTKELHHLAKTWIQNHHV
jgi:hypothetical protein